MTRWLKKLCCGDNGERLVTSYTMRGDPLRHGWGWTYTKQVRWKIKYKKDFKYDYKFADTAMHLCAYANHRGISSFTVLKP